MLRYRVEDTDDGLSGEEGTFVICSFWLVSALVEIGEVDRADDLCRLLLHDASDLGLLAEELDAHSGRDLGHEGRDRKATKGRLRYVARWRCGTGRARRRWAWLHACARASVAGRAPIVAQPSASGVDNVQPLSPVKALALLATLQSADIVLPTPDGREIRLRRITEPTADQKSLLQQLSLTLPQRFELNHKCSADSATA